MRKSRLQIKNIQEPETLSTQKILGENQMIPQIQPWIDDKEWLEVKKVMESTYLTDDLLRRFQ